MVLALWPWERLSEVPPAPFPFSCPLLHHQLPVGLAGGSLLLRVPQGCSEGRDTRKFGDCGRALRHPAFGDAGSALGPSKCGVLLFIASKLKVEGGGFSLPASPQLRSQRCCSTERVLSIFPIASPSRRANPNSARDALGTQSASRGTSTSSSTAFAGRRAGLQLSWGIWSAPGKSASPNFAPAFPPSSPVASAPCALGTPKNLGACHGVCAELPPSRDVKHLSTFCL